MIKDFINDSSKKSTSEIISFMFSHSLIKETQTCQHCGQGMDLKPTKDSRDGFNWRCLTYSCAHYQSTQSIRNGSWFEGQKLPLPALLKFLLYFSQEQKQTTIVENARISLSSVERLSVRIKNTIADLYIRTQVRLGGPGVIVQADETMLNFKAKSHRGRSPRDQIWAITMVDTSFSPARGYVELVPNRTADTLLAIISRVVRPATIIHTDEWRGYNGINLFGYEHHRICHKYNFVDPVSGIHTQHVESYNNKLKRVIKEQIGVKRENHDTFLKVFMFMDNNKDRRIEAIFDLLKL